MNVVSIVGARPQLIKAAAVSRVLRAVPGVREVLVHTGQHYDKNMSEVFFRELEMPKPDYNLGVGSGSHGEQTGRMLMAIEEVLLREKPDWVLVYGDTNSTLAGALVTVKLHTTVAHVEVGLCSFNRRRPEEMNRVLTDSSRTSCSLRPKQRLRTSVGRGLVGRRDVRRCPFLRQEGVVGTLLERSHVCFVKIGIYIFYFKIYPISTLTIGQKQAILVSIYYIYIRRVRL